MICMMPIAPALASGLVIQTGFSNSLGFEPAPVLLGPEIILAVLAKMAVILVCPVLVLDMLVCPRHYNGRNQQQQKPYPKHQFSPRPTTNPMATPIPINMPISIWPTATLPLAS